MGQQFCAPEMVGRQFSVHHSRSVDSFQDTTGGRSAVFGAPLGVGRRFSVHRWGSVSSFRCTAHCQSTVFGAPRGPWQKVSVDWLATSRLIFNDFEVCQPQLLRSSFGVWKGSCNGFISSGSIDFYLRTMNRISGLVVGQSAETNWTKIRASIFFKI